MARATSPGVTGARVCVIVSFVLAAVAIVFYPIVFGVAAIILATIGYRRGDRHLGRYAVIVAVTCTALGFVLGYLALPTYAV
jgi:cytochrome c biogenesis protein CcdA